MGPLARNGLRKTQDFVDIFHKKTSSKRYPKIYYCINSFICRGPYHIETSLLIFRGNNWTVYYMIGTSVMKSLNNFPPYCKEMS